MDIGTNLRTLREKRELSQEKLAELAGVSKETVADWENGVRTPSVEELNGLHESLGVSMDELILGQTGTDGHNGLSSLETAGKRLFDPKEWNVFFKGIKITAIVLGIVIVTYILITLIYMATHGLL